MPANRVAGQSLDLHPRDTLLFYTDGITEAFNATGRMFGENGLLQHLAKSGSDNATETVTRTLDAVRAYVGDLPQSDDIAMVAVQCTG
jgi:sigma-B regulation protein RsbU (phosphoserine phosphatase)